MQMAGKQSQERKAPGYLLVCALAMALALVWARPAWALSASVGQRVDASSDCTITFTKCPAEGQRFTAYLVATMDADGSLKAVDALSDAVDATGIDPSSFAKSDVTAEKIREAALSWQGYIMDSNGSFVSQSVSVKNGTAVIAGLKPGLYLVYADSITVEGTTYISSPYLLSLPSLNDEGTYIYQREVEATKISKTQSPKYRNIVQKLWRGTGTRPDSVHVKIYNGSELFTEVDLNAGNNWTYEWEGQGDWSVAEDAVSGYKASVKSSASEQDQTTTTIFKITNTAPTTKKTGVVDTSDTNWQPTALILLGIGVICVAVALIQIRGRKDK